MEAIANRIDAQSRRGGLFFLRVRAGRQHYAQHNDGHYGKNVLTMLHDNFPLSAGGD